MPRWRISKSAEWTAFSDIGRSWGGVVLTRDAYLAVESAYADTVVRFLTEVGNPPLFAKDVDVPMSRSSTVAPASEGVLEQDPAEGDSVKSSDVPGLVRACLRGQIECRLESADRAVRIGFGYNYYLFIGAAVPCPNTVASAVARGLLVEPMPPEDD